ncbi:TatD family hydrolase [Paludisphaera mucosa]|uniref:TatD family hydrolase n=1 Tax=Paludisphaera mucosa TaxID=3030827 RepID=A0ABT6FIR3_9BACT|nr:TatD family hydrolase [Paludisphaera mucosa]MDG3007285.1 TatD family hydrolase [Paludisphaera mucosa]
MPAYIDPHIHMVSRTTDDYKRMALAGCVMVSEPAFWAGFDRSGVEGFRDYFRQLIEFEARRAEAYGIQHYCWLCINAKEAEDVALARQVVAMIPEFLDHPRVLGIGEIGLNKNTKNEATVFLDHLDLAARTDELILVHTPHLADKYQGTRMILDMIKGDGRIRPERVCIDHVEEHTIRAALDAGCWVGMTLYPISKCTPARAADMVESYGADRVMVNSAGDWGHSDPLAVPEFIFEMRRRGHDEGLIRKVVLENPREFFSQSRRFSTATAT